ncbi:hypothetical protein, partial [Aneurinibacillus aneurinilyticus]|uniref:hypothetical protein n=1 Tax=Aneurinibacillus aneurinilyticus TaxID=1391 RepID=UPI003D1EF48C
SNKVENVMPTDGQTSALQQDVATPMILYSSEASLFIKSKRNLFGPRESIRHSLQSDSSLSWVIYTRTHSSVTVQFSRNLFFVSCRFSAATFISYYISKTITSFF